MMIFHKYHKTKNSKQDSKASTLTFKQRMFTYVNKKYKDSHTNTCKCEQTCCNAGKSVPLYLSVYAGKWSKLLVFCHSTAVCRVTQYKQW